MRSRLPIHDAGGRKDCAERHAAGNSLGAADDVRLDSGELMCPPLSGAAHAGLHFVGDEHDSVLAANPLQFLQKEVRRNDVPAFALNWLDDYSRDFLRIKEPLENLLFELLENFRAASLRGMAVRATIGIWK